MPKVPDQELQNKGKSSVNIDKKHRTYEKLQNNEVLGKKHPFNTMTFQSPGVNSGVLTQKLSSVIPKCFGKELLKYKVISQNHVLFLAQNMKS